MYKIVRIFFLSLLASSALSAQITPKEGGVLNYRLIGFSFPQMKQALTYKVLVAAGRYNDEDSFEHNIVVTATAKKNRLISEVPAFGKDYTWRTVYTDNKSKITKSELHHFRTLMISDVNPDSNRLRIIDTALTYKDDYIFSDGNKTLYDMKGNPVWFFPDSLVPANHEPIHTRDLKVSPFGTITALGGELIYEINYNGDLLWEGPIDSNSSKYNDTLQYGKNHRRHMSRIAHDSTELSYSHHHQFDRLPNGNYMSMTLELCNWRLPKKLDSALFAALHNRVKRDTNGIYYQEIQFAALVEYNKKGEIVWRWSGSDYFKTSDLGKRMAAKGELFDLENTHTNAFYFDAKQKAIYLSFRDLNRILKIQYPSKKVSATYGTLYTEDAGSHLYNGIFCGQHSCRLTKDNYLYLFNNNICKRQPPTIVMMQEPKTSKDSLKKIWEYECPMDELTQAEQQRILFNAGGNVDELPDSAFFVCMGSAYGKLLIVNRDKKVLWCAQPERWNSKLNKWMNQPEYRSSIVSRKDLEKVIWGEPLKK